MQDPEWGTGMKKAVVAGHVCIDITPIFPDQNTTDISKIMIPGRLINMDGVKVHTGGAVANTGLTMKKLGCDVSLMGKISDDEFGKMVLEVFHENGYTNTEDMAFTEESGTSYSVVVAIPGVDRIILHSLGANNDFRYEDIDYDTVGKASVFHFGYPPLMKSMYENDGSEMLKILKKVKSMGVVTSLDMAEADPGSEAGSIDWYRYIERILPYVDFFLPSIEEICSMLDKQRYKEWKSRAAGKDMTLVLDPENDIKPLADMLSEMGADVLMIKCGAPGMYYRTAGAETIRGICDKLELDPEEWADKEGFMKSFIPEKVRSGIGAGDASVAGFLTGALQGKPFIKCVELAAAVGASCVETYDVLSGIRPAGEIEERINAGWRHRE